MKKRTEEQKQKKQDRRRLEHMERDSEERQDTASDTEIDDVDIETIDLFAEDEQAEDRLESGESFSEELPKRSARAYFRERQERLRGMTFEDRNRHHRRMVFLRTFGVAFGLLVVVGGYFLIRDRIAYTDYRVLSTEDRSAGTAIQYEEFDGKILRYSKDGASYYEKQDHNIWNETYEMQNPILDVCGKYAVIAEQDAEQVCLFNIEGLVLQMETTLPIRSVQVSEKGTMVLLLQDEQVYHLQYIDAEGELIAEGKLPFDHNGYPMGFSLSDDGFKLVISYLKAEEGRMLSSVLFYNFSSIGASEPDNVVVSDEYDGMVIPTSYYANSNTAVLFGDSKLLIYKGSQRPQLEAEIVPETEMQSVFYDDQYIGYIMESPNDEYRYRMEVFNLSGHRVFSEDFDFSYEHVKLQDGHIVLFNESEWCIYSVRGHLRLKPCKFSATVTDIVPLSSRKYILVGANKTETVRLK